jgi:hypothetical protein
MHKCCRLSFWEATAFIFIKVVGKTKQQLLGELFFRKKINKKSREGGAL